MNGRREMADQRRVHFDAISAHILALLVLEAGGI